jgi:hypothetical protein
MLRPPLVRRRSAAVARLECIVLVREGGEAKSGGHSRVKHTLAVPARIIPSCLAAA